MSPADTRARSRRVTQPPIDRWGTFCQLYLLALAGLAVAIASRFRTQLHERFTFDGNYIEDTLKIPDASLNPDDPFRNIALVYRVLGLSGSPDVAAMVAIAVFGVSVFAAIRWREMIHLTPTGLGVITGCYLLALIYLAQYSKEFVSLVLVALVLLLPAGWLSELALVGGMIAYAATIRPYWGAVVGLYVLGRILLPRLRGLFPVLILILLTYVGLQLAFNGILGESLSYPRVSVNDTRAGVNVSVGSLIQDFLPDTVPLQWLNAFLVFLSLVVPWPLVLGGSLTYLVMAAMLCFLWAMLMWSLHLVQRERATGIETPLMSSLGHAPLRDRYPRPERAIALLLSLVIVQAIFEPDYGSYVKHLSPMLPLFVALLPLSPTAGWSRRSSRVRAARSSDPSAPPTQKLPT
ncbi:hypothetical protein GCM10022204_43090 [Microlunatus aurantiacus]|uniref:Uncharacterized protein n=1 Tax=Microlunatus aurantiacus TaxID=446786 RepID=A0ABP7EFJ7_9ACTN